MDLWEELKYCQEALEDAERGLASYQQSVVFWGTEIAKIEQLLVRQSEKGGVG